MITITNNSIILPQGETAAVSFGFKDIKTNSPLILANTEVSHYIHVVIKDHVSNKGEAILAKYLQINNTEGGWHIFEHPTLKVIDDLELTEGDTNSSIIERIEDGDEEVLHKIIYKNDKNEIQWIRYCYKDADGNLHDYGYENSSIKIDFQREDTKELQPKTYYLEIYHETVNSRGERTKSTLLPPIDFIINGALA